MKEQFNFKEEAFEMDPELDESSEFGEELEEEYEPEMGGRIGDLDLEEHFAFEEDRESEIIPPKDTRVLVTKTTDAPFRFICNFEYDLPGIGRRSICTGTLIGPRTVLTAGHCLASLDPNRMRVIPGRKGTLEPLPATQAVRFILAPGFSGATRTDYGIIHLADPIGNKVGYWTLKTRSEERRVGKECA